MIQEFPQKALVLILLCERRGCHVLASWSLTHPRLKDRSYQMLFMNITKIFDTNLYLVWSLGEFFYYFYESSPFLALYHLHRDIKHIYLKVFHASLCLDKFNVHSFPNSIVSLKTIFFFLTKNFICCTLLKNLQLWCLFPPQKK